MKRYKRLYNETSLIENITMKDLTKHVGVSSFTSKFAKERQKIKGTGNKSAKIIKAIAKPDKDYVEFIFLQEPTHAFNTKVTQPPSMKLVNDNLYTQQIRLINIFSLIKTDPKFSSYKNVTLDQVKEILKNCDIQIFCDCPSFYWQGMDYNISRLDAAIYPTNISPKHWDQYHNGDQLLCKHLDLLFAQISFFYNLMASILWKYLKTKD